MRNFLGVLLVLSFAAAVYNTFKPSILMGLFASAGTAVGIFCWYLCPASRRPFKGIYRHKDWVFDATNVRSPTLIILENDHGMGLRPSVEFRQGDPVFPVEVDGAGNITIIRNNYSFGKFPDLGVIVRHEL